MLKHVNNEKRIREEWIAKRNLLEIHLAKKSRLSTTRLQNLFKRARMEGSMAVPREKNISRNHKRSFKN